MMKVEMKNETPRVFYFCKKIVKVCCVYFLYGMEIEPISFIV
jgi:hypothetical protein